MLGKTLSSLFLKMSTDMAIDLGTANTLVHIPGRGIVINEPSIVALKIVNGKEVPHAFGSEAKLMLGRTPTRINTIRPLKDGVIADFKAAQDMIKYFIGKVMKYKFVKPFIVICVPSTSTSVERKAIQDAAESAGAREVFLVDEPMAAAIGANLPVSRPEGSMVVDIGGGTTEIAVISLNGLVYSKSLEIGGDKMDEEISNYVKRKYNLLIGEFTAERVKKEIGCAKIIEGQEQRELFVKGRDIQEGIPKQVKIKESDICIALEEPVSKMINAIKDALEQTPPELSADITETGLVLTGGGALLKNLDIAIQEQIGIKVHISEDPLNCVVKGCGYVLENISEFRNL